MRECRRMTEEELLNRIALQNNTPPEEVRKEMQKMIDDLWNWEDDTEEFKKLRFRAGHKPSIMEFIDYCAGAVQKDEEKKPRFFHRKKADAADQWGREVACAGLLNFWQIRDHPILVGKHPLLIHRDKVVIAAGGRDAHSGSDQLKKS